MTIAMTISPFLVICLHKLFERSQVDRLGHYLNHTHFMAPIKCLVADESCDGSDNCWWRIVASTSSKATHRLQLLVNYRFLEWENLLCRLKAVNDRHVQVHEHQLELFLAAGLFPVFDEKVDGLLPTKCLLWLDSQAFEEKFKRNQVKGIVVNY